MLQSFRSEVPCIYEGRFPEFTDEQSVVGLSSVAGSSRLAHQDSIREAVDLKSMEWKMEEARWV